MKMLLDKHPFQYYASVPWPRFEQAQTDWEQGTRLIEHWLNNCVGHRLSYWAWHDSYSNYNVGVAFRLEQHKTLFVIVWAQ
jgi:hypothetical protein